MVLWRSNIGILIKVSGGKDHSLRPVGNATDNDVKEVLVEFSFRSQAGLLKSIICRHPNSVSNQNGVPITNLRVDNYACAVLWIVDMLLSLKPVLQDY